MSLSEAGPARWIDSAGAKIEPISAGGVDLWWGFDEEGCYRTSRDFDAMLLLRMEGLTTASRQLAVEVGPTDDDETAVALLRAIREDAPRP